MDDGRKRRALYGVMLSVFLAAMESTVVATAMPTVVESLGVPLDQHMTRGDEGRQYLLDHGVLADDRLANCRPEVGKRAGCVCYCIRFKLFHAMFVSPLTSKPARFAAPIRAGRWCCGALRTAAALDGR